MSQAIRGYITKLNITRNKDHVPEDMDGILRIGKVIVYFTDGREEDNQEFVDNEEFRYDEEIIASVANRLDIHKDNINIVY
jgi:hypothetical protein